MYAGIRSQGATSSAIVHCPSCNPHRASTDRREEHSTRCAGELSGHQTISIEGLCSTAGLPWTFNGAYFGTDRLWTMFPIKGVLKGTTASGATHLELVWFRQGYNQWVEPTPRLKVHGKRLDGTARGVAVSQPKFIGSTPRNAMLVGLDIPDSGCWQITGRFEDEELAFVVWVTK